MKTWKSIDKRGWRITMMLLCLAMMLVTHAFSQPANYKGIAGIVEAQAKYDLFSGTVLVAENGKIIYAKGFGEENKEYQIPNVLETRFNISSVQKTFIATLIMQLYQEGKIDLDDPLTKYFPDCPWKEAGQIRIKNLLNHTSGLGDYRDNDEYRLNSERYTCIDDVLPMVYKYEPAFTPGERFRYSNAGVLLLKGIIEKITGGKLQQALAERILKPSGMESTAFYCGGDILKNRATAYQLAGNGDEYVRVLGEPSAYTGGGIYTTVLDLLKFDQALYGDELLNAESKRIMFTPVAASPNYAYGWQVLQFGGTTVVCHSGGSGGFNSEFKRYPEKGLTVIVLSNYPDGAYYLVNKIECLLFGLPYALATEADQNYNQGMHIQNREDYRKAIEIFEKNTQGSEPHLPSLYQAARSRILGEFDQTGAIELLDRYISLANETTRPSIGAAWWRKGIAFEQSGNIKEAIACQRKCLELDPGFEDAIEALVRLGAGD